MWRVWSLAVSLLDNVLRPLLVGRTVGLPVLLIFLGAVGGLFAFGPLGIFIGPVVLALAYTLLSTWMRAGAPALASPRTTSP